MSDIKLFTSVSEAVRNIFGESRHVVKRNYVAGGDINEAYALTLDDGTILFMKSNALISLENFLAEAAGLEEIRATGAIGGPDVLGAGTDADFSFLLLAYIRGGSRISHYWETFAEELAAMHRAGPSGFGKYGFEEDNWIGARKQVNTPYDKWVPFFRDCRLAPQIRSAENYLLAEDMRRAGYLLDHLDRFLVEPERPSLVHGDLWSGNMITGDDGKGWLIDPAVYCGHPEVDIAMTELFGGFPQAFYDAYRDTGMLQPGYGDRRDLYNLYQLLNHLNMFGRGYLYDVRRILKKYAG